MKHLLIVVFLSLSISSFSQKSKDTTAISLLVCDTIVKLNPAFFKSPKVPDSIKAKARQSKPETYQPLILFGYQVIKTKPNGTSDTLYLDSRKRKLKDGLFIIKTF